MAFIHLKTASDELAMPRIDSPWSRFDFTSLPQHSNNTSQLFLALDIHNTLVQQHTSTSTFNHSTSSSSRDCVAGFIHQNFERLPYHIAPSSKSFDFSASRDLLHFFPTSPHEQPAPLDVCSEQHRPHKIDRVSSSSHVCYSRHVEDRD